MIVDFYDIEKKMDFFAKELIEKGLSMIVYLETSERNFAVFHYDYDLEIPAYAELNTFLNYYASIPEFNKMLYGAICKDERVLECDIGTIEWCTVEIVYTDEAIRNYK